MNQQLPEDPTAQTFRSRAHFPSWAALVVLAGIGIFALFAILALLGANNTQMMGPPLATPEPVVGYAAAPFDIECNLRVHRGSGEQLWITGEKPGRFGGLIAGPKEVAAPVDSPCIRIIGDTLVVVGEVPGGKVVFGNSPQPIAPTQEITNTQPMSTTAGGGTP